MIEGDTVHDSTAEELGNGLPGRFADEVPERHVDGGDRIVAQPTKIVPAAVLVQPTSARLDPGRIPPFDQRGALPQYLDHDRRRGTADGFSEADETFVRVDLQNHARNPVSLAPGPELRLSEWEGDRGDVDTRDLHGSVGTMDATSGESQRPPRSRRLAPRHPAPARPHGQGAGEGAGIGCRRGDPLAALVGRQTRRS